MKKYLLISFIFTTCVYTAISQVKNNFKIGFCIDSWSSDNGSIISSTTRPSPNQTLYSSAMNVLSEDGVNFIRSYEPDIYMTQANYKNFIQLCGNNGMTMIDHYEEWFKSKPNDPNGTSGTAVWDISSINPNAAFGNYNALFTNVYNLIPYKNIVFGHIIAGESNYSDHQRVHEGIFPSGYADKYPAQWSPSKVPAPSVSNAMAHFYPLSSPIGQNLLQVQAYHAGSISDDPANTIGFEVSKYLQIPNKGDVYVEASYSSDVWNEWRKQTIPINFDYLGKYKSIDYAKQYYSKIFAEIDLECTNAYNVRAYMWNTNLTIPNANLTWFQAYNSIIHGATGLIFWGINLSYDTTITSDDLNKKSFNNGAPLYSDNYNFNNFPNIYKNSISNLSKELRYLKEKNFLTSENNVIYSKTTAADPNCILPPSISYLPVNVNSINGQDMITFFASHGYTDNPTLYNYHRTEDFGIRYTIRTNGDEVIMIASNPNPYCVRTVKFDFNNIANPVIKNATGIDVLFENYNTQGVASSTYKVDRNWIDRTTFKNNINSNLPAITSAMRKYTLNFSPSDKSFIADFGPLDVHVYKFSGNINGTNYSTYWKKSWTNFGSGNVAWASFNDIDKRVMGDFTGDGNCELLTLQGLNSGGWGYLIGYKKATATTTAQLNDWLWCNNDHEGLGVIKWWGIGSKDKYVSGDFNADGKDELLCIQGENTSALSAMIGFKTTTGLWDNWYWCNNDHEGRGKINSWNMVGTDKYISGDFDADGRDELFCLQSQSSGCRAALIGYNKTTNLWDSWLWSNDQHEGLGTIKWWGFGATDRPLVGDFINGDGKDELLLLQSSNSGAWAAMLGFNKVTGLWDNWYWCNNDHEGLGKISTWQIKTTDKFVIGDFDGNGREDLLCIQTGVGASMTKLLTYNNGWSVLWESTDQRLHDWYINDGVDADYLPFKQKNSSNQKVTGVLCTRKYACDKYLASIYQLSNTLFKPTTSIESFDDNKFTIYPNPSSGIIDFTFTNEIHEKILIQVDDCLGRGVYQNYFENTFNEIDLSSLTNGVYFFKATIDHNVSVKKIIINK